jgi:hypothetical protein
MVSVYTSFSGHYTFNWRLKFSKTHLLGCSGRDEVSPNLQQCGLKFILLWLKAIQYSLGCDSINENLTNIKTPWLWKILLQY